MERPSSNLNPSEVSKAKNKSMMKNLNARSSRPFVTKHVGTPVNQLPLRYIETSELSV